MRRTLASLFAVLAAGCTNQLSLEVELYAPEAPDPFADVLTVRMRALVLGEVVTLGEDRWDQGPIDLPVIVDPDVERFVVEGLSRDGRVISTGASAPLDLLSAPPEGRLRIFFSRAGELSMLPETAPVRNGGRAVELDDRRVLFAGGLDEEGRALETTEIAGQRGIENGPPLSGGRAGNFRALLLPDGRVVIADSGLGRPAIMDPRAKTTRFCAATLPERPGAAIAVVSNELLVVAGGEVEGVPSDELYRFNLESCEPETPGKLFDARTLATASVVGGGRVLLAGGRDEDGIKRDAPVFDPIRGGSSLRSIDLGGPMLAPASVVLASGNAILISGSRVASVVAQPERAQAFGDTSTVTAVIEGVDPQLIDLDDGSVLVAGETIQWIDLFSGNRMIAAPAGPWRGGRIEDGTVRLRSDGGLWASFNPGTHGVLGAFDPDLSIIPLRPQAWTKLAANSFEGRLLPGLPTGAVITMELAVLGSSDLDDFELAFTLELAALSQAAIAFSHDRGAFDHISFLGNIAAVGRVIAGGAPEALGCPSAETPALSDGEPHRIRIARRRGELRMDIGDDGSEELRCQTSGALPGRLALGVINGRAKFTDLKITLPFR